MRLEWTCRCGYASYDDFTGRPGATTALAHELKAK